MSDLEQREHDVLAYYAREARGHRETQPLAGLSLSAFRAARERLVRKGLLICASGRYRPVDALKAA